MQQVHKLIITFLSFTFLHTAQATPGKIFFYNNEIGAFNEVQYLVNPANEVSVKTAWIKKHVVMSWQTTKEVNTSYFDIQRSYNGIDYETIECIPAHSDCSNISTYAFIDSKNEKRRGQSYYRLKAVFTDGAAAFTSGLKAKKTGLFNRKQHYPAAAGSVISN